MLGVAPVGAYESPGAVEAHGPLASGCSGEADSPGEDNSLARADAAAGRDWSGDEHAAFDGDAPVASSVGCSVSSDAIGAPDSEGPWSIATDPGGTVGSAASPPA